MQLSLIDTTATVILVALGSLSLLGLLYGRSRGWFLRRVPLAAIIALVVAGAVALIVDEVWKPFADKLPFVALAAVFLLVLAVGLVALKRFSWKLLPLRILAVLLVAAMGGGLVNHHYGAYPTVRAALQLPPEGRQEKLASADKSVVVAGAGQTLQETWTPPSDLPSVGNLSEVPIPGTQSGFAARPAWVYQPPAYLTTPRAELPVVILMAGQPGSPRDWLDGGDLVNVMNTYAEAHEGLAPVVVVVDNLGSPLSNPACFDSPLGNVFTYLSVDVPAWIHANLQVSQDPSQWVVAGLSSGGTCALQLAVNAPDQFPNFLDISGEREPATGDSPAETIEEAFGGDAAAFAAVNPLDVMGREHFPKTRGQFVNGAEDDEYGPAAIEVSEAAKAAGMTVELKTLPGNHGWGVWKPGLVDNLDWIARVTGLSN